MNVIYGGADAFNAVLYQDQHPANMNYFQKEISSFSNTLTDVGKQFFSGVQTLYDQINSSEAMRIAKAALNMAKSITQPNSIRSLFELPEIQNAPLMMQRFIMANPMVRELYHEQRCDGYSGTYIDMQPGKTQEEHYDYRRVMNGIVQQDTQGTMFYTQYLDELHHGDKELALTEQVKILDTWEIAEMFIKAGNDPTSVWNESL